MAVYIKQDETIVDFIELEKQIRILQSAKPLYAMALNKAEWLSFLNLYVLNYKDCKSQITIENKEQHIAKYGELIVYWSGADTAGLDYMRNFEYLQHELAVLTNSPQAAQETPVTGRPRSNRPRATPLRNRGMIDPVAPGTYAIPTPPSAAQSFSVDLSTWDLAATNESF